jgi:hypothetical protein
LLAAAAPASADDRRREDPHARGARQHARYFRPPARYHDNHHYYEGEVWHGHPLIYRNGYWGYTGPAGIFIHISL